MYFIEKCFFRYKAYNYTIISRLCKIRFLVGGIRKKLLIIDFFIILFKTLYDFSDAIFVFFVYYFF